MPARSLRASSTRNPAWHKQRGHGRFLAGAQFHDQPAAGRQQAAARRRRWRDNHRVRQCRRRARGRDRNSRTSGGSGRFRRWRCKAGSTRRGRTARRARGRHRRRRMCSARRARAGRRCRARRSSAATLMSVPTPARWAIRVSIASNSAPEPVPMSRTRSVLHARARRAASSALSTTVSVSGRGTSTAGVTRKGRLQNSLRPRMRATGSRASRRAASAEITSLSRRFDRRAAVCDSSCARSMPSA